MKASHTRTDRELLNRARIRLLRMHHQAGVGHIGGNLSALDALVLLQHEYIGAEDQLILSKGHGAGALYTALWSAGKLPDEALDTFHKDNTLLPGHPPCIGTNDIPFATGSLGHGLSLAAGTALGKRLQSHDGHVYCLTSDGEWQEGSTWEALIFAAHQRLNNLTILVDHNRLQGFGTTAEVASMSPLTEKLRPFAVDVREAAGHDLASIRQALDTPADQPKLIVLHTIKGHGVSFMQNRMEWHYLPINTEQLACAIHDIENLP